MATNEEAASSSASKLAIGGCAGGGCIAVSGSCDYRRERRRASMQDAIDASKINADLYSKVYNQTSAIQSIQEENLGQLNFSLSYREDTGILTVRIIQTIDLQPKDSSTGSVNPYCRVALLPNRKTQSTTKLISTSPVSRRYDIATLRQSALIYLISSSAYSQLRTLLPLPHQRTLRTNLAGLGEIGTAADSDETIRTVFSALRGTQLNCVLLFDEMYVQPSVRFRCKHLFGQAEDDSAKIARTILAIMLKPLMGGKPFILRLIPIFLLTAEFLKQQLSQSIELVNKHGGTVFALVHKKTLRPEFEEAFIFELAQQDIHWSVLEITVFDYDPCSLDDCLGQVRLPLTDVLDADSAAAGAEVQTTLWKGLTSLEKDPDPEHKIGDLMFSLSFLSAAKRLGVSIIKARNLRDINKDKPISDASVRVTLSTQGGRKQKKKKTSSCKTPGNPVWEEALVFNGVAEEDLRIGCLEISVCHEGVLSSTEVGRVYLGPDTSGQEYQHWWNMLKSKSAPARWHRLTAPAASGSRK
uniref:C2 domain-containing protein n=1 Tax=Macrostomum lignano TaxID=282301 RepID=A0A1I8FWY0_9PLAT